MHHTPGVVLNCPNAVDLLYRYWADDVTGTGGHYDDQLTTLQILFLRVKDVNFSIQMGF